MGEGTRDRAFGATLARHLRQDDAPATVTQTKRNQPLAVMLVRTDGTRTIETEPMRPEDAFHIILQRHDMPSHELWSAGRLIHTDPYPRDSVSIIDLRDRARTRMRAAHEALVFYMSREALNEVASDYGTPPVDGLTLAPGTARLDPVIARVGEYLLPTLLEDVAEPSQLLVDQLMLVTQAHVVHAFGHRRPMRLSNRGGLAAGQERRAKELMQACLDRPLSLSDLARECSLSVSHFTRAFRSSTGMPPHKWLTQQRIDAAKSMLMAVDRSIAEIALASGFAEQSSFTRAFTRVVGTTPAAWRRAMRA